MKTKPHWFTRVAISAVFGVIALFLLPYILYNTLFSKTEEPVVGVEWVRTDETPEKKAEAFTNGTLSASQMQADMDALFAMTSDFSETATIPVEPDSKKTPEPVVYTDAMQAQMTAYLDGLFLQRTKLNKLLPVLQEEIKQVETVLGTPLRDHVEPIIGMDKPLLDGLFSELAQTPLYLLSNKETYDIRIDYDAIRREYEGYLTPFQQDLIRFHQDVMEHGYTHADGTLNPEALYNRLVLLDAIQQGSRAKDDFYWEKERHQLAVLLTGYGDEKRPDWSPEQLEQMAQLGQKNKEKDPYAAILDRLVPSYKAEKSYGEKTIRIANEWMQSEFSDYKAYLEK